jgi:hypothetical protein
MTSFIQQQIFKSVPSPDILFTFLEDSGEVCDDYYIFSKILYKQAVFHDLITPLINCLESHYYESKKHYINRKMDYNKFITVIRQICNSNSITYTTKMNYHNSTYDIVYYIYKKEAVVVDKPSEG